MHDIEYIIAVTKAEYKSEFRPAKDTPNLTITGELWGGFRVNFGENWSLDNATHGTYIKTYFFKMIQHMKLVYCFVSTWHEIEL